jgi:hypothetical protein
MEVIIAFAKEETTIRYSMHKDNSFCSSQKTQRFYIAKINLLPVFKGKKIVSVTSYKAHKYGYEMWVH